MEAELKNDWYMLDGRTLYGQSINGKRRVLVREVPPHITTTLEAGKWYEKGGRA